MIVQSAQLQTIKIDTKYARLKRLLDVTCTLLLAPVVLLVGVIVALCIKLDSPGPIFFRQKRIGQHGEVFELLKFRSMHLHSDQKAHQETILKYMQGQKLNEDCTNGMSYKVVHDPRITRVGRFIRRTSLDEIPQFWNIVRGEMSLVGPRPPLPYEVAAYGPHERLRLSGKPGLTGIWQVYGRSRVSFQRMVEMDITYLHTQSLWLDLRIIFLTIPVVFFARGGA